MEEKSPVTMERIQKAALEEFSEKGFLGASLRQIVKNAGVTTGAFYGYFSSRRVKETIAIFGTAIWNSWRSPPRGIFERDWVPRWSRGSWSAPGRTAQTPCV